MKNHYALEIDHRLRFLFENTDILESCCKTIKPSIRQFVLVLLSKKKRHSKYITLPF